MKKEILFLLLLTCTFILTACTSQAQVNPKTELEQTSTTSADSLTAASANEAKAKNSTYLDVEAQNLDLLSYDLYINNNKVDTYSYDDKKSQFFDDTYTNLEGVLTFRGNHLRNQPAYGQVNKNPENLHINWDFTTGSRSWGPGAGWTGQPVLVKWEEKVRKIMNIKEEFQDQDLVEVIQGSLDGRIYFLDLATGKATRDPIDIRNPIKGSISVDPRGYPLLYVGQGIQETDKFGFYIYSLIDGQLLHFINGRDRLAYSNWGAFDSSAVVNSKTDSLIVGGENGFFYNLKLNTNFNLEKGTISIEPEEIKYRYQIRGNPYQGIENSVALYRNIAFFADNGGSVQAINLQNMEPLWALPMTDDTDATIVLDIEEEKPYLFTGTEVDKIKRNGSALLRKIDGLTGETSWSKEYPAFYNADVNGGLLATPVVGKKKINNLVIFTLSRYKTHNGGLMVALDKDSGEEIWRWEMQQYAWSSPVDFYTAEGQGYLIQCDSVGNIFLIDAEKGIIIDKINVGSNIEASPAIFNNQIVIASRGGKIFNIEVK
ncbi:pyrrolo-quinoline quinone [Heliorestis acidaminivorans]|uniref:Pyrrolo-quinoline quinone n=1 Tax=Heliorestis acidaminivorans TaxID=553427 RepID=A0A6I0F353_9FIRM|nr:PQQ-binding-like beta-propeller repeat protein [Heliorestis acidaminivorans]KAB2953823.1 pyrrolo-quinoline quinone [Heliorestis acidaminivorans]